jgi:hypothetical protein
MLLAFAVWLVFDGAHVHALLTGLQPLVDEPTCGLLCSG